MKPLAQLNPETITVLDPACGSGHILVEAYDVLKAIYLERGYRMRDIPRLILEKNLYGLDIDERAAQLAGFALLMKARADDRCLLDNPPKINVLALQESKGLDADEIIQSLNTVRAEPVEAHHTRQLIDTFAHALTFGSLIQIPPDLNAQLPAMDAGLQLAIQSGDLLAQEAALNLLPLVRQARILGMQFDAVVANPPYMGGKGMNPVLKDYAKHTFPDSKSDLFAMFIERGFAWCKPSGFNSMVTMQSWMFLSSYQAMREKLLTNRTIQTIAHLGARAFSEISGEVVQTTAFVFHGDCFSGYIPTFFRLVDGSEEQKQAALLSGESQFNKTVQDDFKKIPGSPIAYWVSDNLRDVFYNFPKLEINATPKQGLATGDNNKFLRNWNELDFCDINFHLKNYVESVDENIKWVPYSKGGGERKWFGFNEQVVYWKNGGNDIRNFKDESGNERSRFRGYDFYFYQAATWGLITSGNFSCLYRNQGFVYDIGGMSLFADEENLYYFIGFLNSILAFKMLRIINPTLNFQAGDIGKLPLTIKEKNEVTCLVNKCIDLSRADWDSYETSWDFTENPLVRQKQNTPSATISPVIPAGMPAFSPVGYASRTAANELHSTEQVRDAYPTLEASYNQWQTQNRAAIIEMQRLEEENNRLFIEAYGLQDELSPEIPEEQITLTRADRAKDCQRLISYAIGCMMGRYRLGRPGLFYAHAGNVDFDKIYYSTDNPPFEKGGQGGISPLAQDKSQQQIPPNPPFPKGGTLLVDEDTTCFSKAAFQPDADGIVPITDELWYEDDAANRIREFLLAVWGNPSPHPPPQGEGVDANMAWLTESLGQKANETPIETIRRYLAGSFFKDHLQTYKKRPIYWLFSSGKQGTFQALVYLHRYHESTLARMRAEYDVPLTGKIQSRIEMLEKDAAAAASNATRSKLNKDIEKLRKKHGELLAYDEKLRHYADQRIRLDLDDGVKVNYGKFGDLLAEVKAETGGKNE